MNEQLDIFEFKTKIVKDNEIDLLKGLDRALNQIWRDRGKYYNSADRKRLSKSKSQKYAKIVGSRITPNGFVGSVQFRNNGNIQSVNFLPKIFYNDADPCEEKDRKNIFLHILWWLSNSEKQFFVANNLSLDSIPTNFIEAYVFIFSSYTVDVLTVNTYQYYHTVEEDLETIRGQVNFNDYIKNYSKGNLNKVSCIFDSFQVDNLFNRIIKYVCYRLSEFTQNKKNKQNLDEIIFLLDEVELVTVSAEDCNKVSLNPIYTELITILDYCKLFLSSLSTYSNDNEYSVMGLLIPTEKLYENLLLSLLKKHHIPEIIAAGKNSAGRSFLAVKKPIEKKRFQMINDIIVELKVDLENKEKFILFDAKYKEVFIKNDSADEDSGEEDLEEADTGDYNIDQKDIYQMVSYAISKKVKNIGLFYPLLKNEDEFPDMPYFEIKDEFTDDTIIRVFAFKVNICHEERLKISSVGKLDKVFSKTKDKLILQLNNSVTKILKISNA